MTDWLGLGEEAEEETRLRRPQGSDRISAFVCRGFGSLLLGAAAIE